MNSIKVKIGIGVGLIAVVTAGWIFYYNNFTFHVTKTTPSASNMATLTPSLKISVNKEIESIGEIISSPSVSYIESYTFDGKEIVVSLVDLPADKKVTISFNDIKSVDGHTLNTAVSFNAAEKNANELPEDQYKELMEKQDRKTNTYSDPIQAAVPYSTNNYALSLLLKGKNDEGKAVYEIEARIILSAADVRINRDGAVNQYKNEIAAYLVSKGIDVNKYTITYTIEEPSLY